MKRIFIFIILLSVYSVCLAENPIISHVFTADPAALVYNDRVYLYTGHDESDGSG